MTKITANFENQTICVGLDVHKRSWNAGIFLGDMFVKNIHQRPSPEVLYNYLTKQFPWASYQCAYESGKFGYWIQRQLSEFGISCLVVNPADIPSSHKDEVYKTDSRDSRGIGQALAKGQLRGIYIPPIHQEADRTLIRQRKKIWCDLVRCKNRVKCFLDYNGVNLPDKFDNPNWSRNFITWLLSLAFPFESTSRRFSIRSGKWSCFEKNSWQLATISESSCAVLHTKNYTTCFVPYLVSDCSLRPR